MPQYAKKDSELVLAVYCPVNRVAEVERSLKRAFCQAFQRHGDGFEWFIGDYVEMTLMMTKAAMLAVQEERRSMNVRGSLRQIAEESTSNQPVREAHSLSPDEASTSTHEATQPGAVTDTAIHPVREAHSLSPDEASTSTHEATQPRAVTDKVIPRKIYTKQYLAVVCPRCDATFRDKYALKIHLNGKRGCDVGKFLCNKCHKRFSQASNRSRHQTKCQGLSQPRTNSEQEEN